MKAAFYTLGCKVNQYETQIMEQKLADAGFEIVSPDCPADVYIINSCTVTAESDRKTRQMLRRLKRHNPHALAVLTGCFPQSAPERAAAFEEADVVTGVRGRGHIDRLIAEAMGSGRRIVRVTDFTPGEDFEPMEAERFAERTRAFVKIEDGCRNFCSYCIIPYSRGPVRSKPLDQLREELAGLTRAGYRETVLVGINLSAYGSDFGRGLADAVETAQHSDGIERIRLGSLEPHIVTEDFVARALACPKLCPHFHLSLQSGCDATLRRMNRRYTTDEYRQAVARLRAAFPGCGITTDVIVGFPGETEDEFAQSLAFVREIAFSQTHVFCYSRRAGTRAALMPDQIPQAEKERRSRLMIAECRKSRDAFWQAMEGRVCPVLFEERKTPGVSEGFAPNYTPVQVQTERDLHGSILPVRITGADRNGCVGELTG